MGFILINNLPRLWNYKIDPFAGPGLVVFVPGPLFAAAGPGKDPGKILANIYLLGCFLSLRP